MTAKIHFLIFAVVCVGLGFAAVVAVKALTSGPDVLVLTIGNCKIAPPSPLAAVAIISWLYGIGREDGLTWEDYQAAVANQYVAAGQAPREAVESIKHIERCFSMWRTS